MATTGLTALTLVVRSAATKFLLFILGIHLALLGWVLLDQAGLEAPVLRQVLGFVYLTFIPGIVIVRLLRLDGLTRTEALLYTVGLSILFSMLIGLIINFLYPLVGVSNPISTLPVLITYCVVVPAMSALSRKGELPLFLPRPGNLKEMLSPPVLCLLSLPLLSIFGTHLMNLHEDNRLLLAMIGLIAIFMGLIAFDRFIPRRLYPMAIGSIAFSLLLHQTLITADVPGFDLRLEFFMHKVVEANSYWNPSSPAETYNTVLSVTIWPTIYSDLLGIDGKWVFKTVFPFVLALVPVGFYEIYRRQTTDRVAMLGAFFIASSWLFYNGMAVLGKQAIATFFLTVAILAMLHSNKHIGKMKVLTIGFLGGMILSHWGVSYFFIMLSLPGLLILTTFRNNAKVLTIGLAALLVVATLAWHMYTTDALVFTSTVLLADSILQAFGSSILSAETSHAGGVVLKEAASPLREADRWLQIVPQLFIGLGLFGVIARAGGAKFRGEFFFWAVVAFVLMVSFLLVPALSNNLALSRPYFLALLFLAPLSILGGEIFFRSITGVVRIMWRKGLQQNPRRAAASSPGPGVSLPFTMMAIFLIIFFLFNTRFVHALVHDYPLSVPLDSRRDAVHFNTREELGARWLLRHKSDSASIYGDFYAVALFSAYAGGQTTLGGEEGAVKELVAAGQKGLEPIPDEASIFLRTYNIREQEVLPSFRAAEAHEKEYLSLENLSLSNRNKIYDNGGARVFR